MELFLLTNGFLARIYIRGGEGILRHDNALVVEPKGVATQHAGVAVERNLLTDAPRVSVAGLKDVTQAFK